MSATECTASASMAEEPVTAYAASLHAQMAVFALMATSTARSERASAAASRRPSAGERREPREARADGSLDAWPLVGSFAANESVGVPCSARARRSAARGGTTSDRETGDARTASRRRDADGEADADASSEAARPRRRAVGASSRGRRSSRASWSRSGFRADGHAGADAPRCTDRAAPHAEDEDDHRNHPAAGGGDGEETRARGRTPPRPEGPRARLAWRTSARPRRRTRAGTVGGRPRTQE